MKKIMTYLASDLCFFSTAAAKKAKKKTVKEYNEFIIEQINKTATKDDYVILNGELSKGSTIVTLELFSKIKAKKIILRSSGTIPFADLNEWKKACYFVLSIDGTSLTKILDKESKIIITSDPKRLEAYIKDPTNFVAAPQSILKEQTEIYDTNMRILNSSLSNFNYTPIEIGKELPTIIEDYELFAHMDETTEKRWES